MGTLYIETFISGAETKKEVIKKAYREVDTYEKKIRLLLRNNLIKSLLMLAFNTYQEITPLNNSGKVLDVIMWFEGKAQDYILSTEAIPQKDYYDRQITSVSDNCKNLTSDVKLLSQMSKAGLEAFKAKIQREQNKTVGNVGALYGKLSALAKQSEKAKRSLYDFYIKLNNLVMQSDTKLASIDAIIFSYIAAKDDTCKEQSGITYTTVEDYNTIKITFPTAIRDDDTCDDDKKKEKDAIIAEQKSNINQFSNAFHNRLAKIVQDTKDVQKELYVFVQETQLPNFQKNTLWYLETGKYDTSVLSCNFMQYNKMSNVINKSNSYYQALLSTLNKAINKIKTNMKKYDELAKYVEQNSYVAAIKDEENTLRVKIMCGEGIGDSLNDNIKKFKESIKGYKQLDKNTLQKDIYKQKNIQKVMDKILPDTKTAINKCLNNDEKVVLKYIPIVKEEINRASEYIMSGINLFNYLKELKDKHIASLSTYYQEGAYDLQIYDINTTYFQAVYDNFKGNDIEFLNKIKNIVLPIYSKLSKLYTFYKTDQDLTYKSGAADVFDFYGNPSLMNANLSVNLEDMKTLKELFQEKGNLISNISFPDLDLKVLNFMEDFLTKGYIKTTNFVNGKTVSLEPFNTIAHNIYLENQQKSNQLGRLTDDLKNGFYKDINGYKKAKQSLDKIRDFYYQLGQVYNGYIKDDEIAKAQKALHTQAKSSLPAMQAEQFDYSKPQVYKTPEPMELNISNSSIDLPSLSNSKVTVNINTAYDIKVILTALDDSNKSLKLTPSWSKDMESSEYKDKNFTLQIDSLDNKDATYTITLKLEDYNAALFGSPYLQPYITKTITVNVFSDKKTISLKKGWNLISGSIDLSSLPKDIDIIWSYDDGFWSGFSPFDYLQELISKVSIDSNINPMKSISDNVGIWIHSLKEQNVQILLKKSTKIQKIIKKSGWNLAGTKNKIQIPDDLSCSDDRILKAVWRYDSSDKSWQNYQKDSNTSTLKNIGENEGFWVLCM